MNLSPANLRVRPMTPADLDQVMALALSLSPAPRWPLSAYQAALNPQSAPRRIALAAADLDTGEVAGFLVAGLLPPQAELETIAVAAKGQRSGVGSLLFAAMAEELKSEQVTEVILEVRASNRPALAFYRSLGFLETGRRPRYYVHPQEDAVLLTLLLP